MTDEYDHEVVVDSVDEITPVRIECPGCGGRFREALSDKLGGTTCHECNDWIKYVRRHEVRDRGNESEDTTEQATLVTDGGTDPNGRDHHDCPECGEHALWEGPDAGYWTCDECGRRFTGSLDDLSVMELYADGGKSTDETERTTVALDVLYESSQPSEISYFDNIYGMMKFEVDGSTATLDDRWDRLGDGDLKSGFTRRLTTGDVLRSVEDLPFIDEVAVDGCSTDTSQTGVGPMATTDAPAEPITILSGHRVGTLRTATPDAIDTERYADTPAGATTYYLVALAPLADADEHAAVYATADGAHVRTLQGERLPHALGGLRWPARSTLRRHGRRMVATLSEIVARAHPEVPKR